MKSVNIKYLYFDDQVCGRSKEDVSCRSYGDTGQLPKNLILAALEKIL